MSEKQRLHTTIWKIADELRGSVDGWDFKNYVLGFLFYRFLSENFVAHINEKQSSG
ncbi:type I restriction-modification system subunit M N-terminal domain-containing protein, partial [uncultured Helicobacter sp.]